MGMFKDIKKLKDQGKEIGAQTFRVLEDIWLNEK